jgi:cation transport ATPase
VKVENQDADTNDGGVQMEDGEGEKAVKEAKKGATKGAKKEAKVTKEVKVKKELKKEAEEEEEEAEEEEQKKEVKEEMKEEVILSEVSTFSHISGSCVWEQTHAYHLSAHTSFLLTTIYNIAISRFTPSLNSGAERRSRATPPS